MADVFISYSRMDQGFVRILHQALSQSQCNAWVDWEDIPLSADWWKEIQAGIEAANTFLFVMSPDSLRSEVCKKEVDYAAINHKRIIPIVWRDGFSREVVPEALGRHNWLFFRETDDFDAAFQALIKTLDTDLEYVKFHTRLLVRSREWEAQGNADDYLLRGKDLDASETWLAQGGKQSPSPTLLQRDYVHRSRQAETARQQQQSRRLKLFAGVVSALAVLALGAAGVALQQRQKAMAQQKETYAQSKRAFANQLAVENRNTVQNQLRSPAGQVGMLAQAEESPSTLETTERFGLARLPEELATLLRQENPRLITFSPSQTYVAIINEAYDLRVWHVPSQRLVLAWGVDSNVADVGFSPNEMLLTVATRDGVLHIWSTATEAYTAKTSLTGHTQPLTDSAFSTDGELLATASEDGQVILWRLTDLLNESLRQKMVLRHPRPVQTVTFSPDDQYVLTGSEDETLRVWTLDGQVPLCLSHDDPVGLVMFNVDGTQVGSVSGETLVRVWPWPQLLEAGPDLPGVQVSCP